MKPDARFLKASRRFWAHAKFISEQLKYSVRGTGQLRTYTVAEAGALLERSTLSKDEALLTQVVTYLNWRTELLNKKVAPLFMNREEAAKEFEAVRVKLKPTKPLPMNKQKGEKKHNAYLASLVAMIAENVLGPDGFIDDARKLSVLTVNNVLEDIFSRRFDGAIPNTKNPRAVWEIKEYYGTTTFGSRVADGVYETLLDGHEIEETKILGGPDIAHFLFIDDRFTWWDCGRSYLCRMIDMLHTGHVDQIFFGREVLTEWEPALRSYVKKWKEEPLSLDRAQSRNTK